MIKEYPQLWNQRAETRSFGTKLQDIKSRLVDQVGVNAIGEINLRVKHLSPEQLRGANVETIVGQLKDSILSDYSPGPRNANSVFT